MKVSTLITMQRSGEQVRVLAFEPFNSGSHRAVRESIVCHSSHNWAWITRPGRFWKWRMRTAAIEMVEAVERLEVGRFRQQPHFDVILATSLMSIADLRALLPPHYRTTPLVLYMHENQAAYPFSDRNAGTAECDVHFALTNLTSVLAADMVIWNSAWNRDSFLTGIHEILQHGSDFQIPADLSERIMAKSRVVWPPVEWPGQSDGVLHNSKGGQTEASIERGGESSSGEIRVVWPHRWEHDKGPNDLLDIARQYSEPLNIRWTILGEQFRTVPPAMAQFQQEFASRIDHVGFVDDRTAYIQHLQRCHWVLSTAEHEFFGIAVVESLLAGCLPWLPMRLSYPELLPPPARGLHPMRPPTDADAIRTAIRSHLQPCIAPNAVAELDRSLAELVRE